MSWSRASIPSSDASSVTTILLYQSQISQKELLVLHAVTFRGAVHFVDGGAGCIGEQTTTDQVTVAMRVLCC